MIPDRNYNTRAETLQTAALDSLADLLTDIRCSIRDATQEPPPPGLDPRHRAPLLDHAQSAAGMAETLLRRARAGGRGR